MNKNKEQRNNGEERKNKRQEKEIDTENRGRRKAETKRNGDKGYEEKKNNKQNSCTFSAFLCLGLRQRRQKLDNVSFKTCKCTGHYRK